MFDAYQRTLAEVEELNMIPVMNLFIVLIPFLLSAAAFYQVAVIPTSTPQQVAAPATDEDTSAVMVNLVIRADGSLTLSVSGGGADEESLRGMGAELPAKAGKADVAALQTTLASLKARYPSSETAFILPEDSVGVQMLVEIVDSVRERPSATGAVETLFPVTVLSQFVAAPPAEIVPDVDLELLPEAPPGAEGAGEPAPTDAPAGESP
ncbi:MAG: biopolymer transporter ExbD [Myxococcota bacterium]